MPKYCGKPPSLAQAQVNREADANTANPQENDITMRAVTRTVVIVVDPVAYKNMVTEGLMELSMTSISDGMHIYNSLSTT